MIIVAVDEHHNFVASYDIGTVDKEGPDSKAFNSAITTESNLQYMSLAEYQKTEDMRLKGLEERKNVLQVVK